MEELLSKYRPRGLEKGGDLILRFADALEFIEDCRQQGFIILCMNFWLEVERGLCETLQWADLFEFRGQPDGAEASARAAAAILCRPMPGGETWVSFIVEDDVS